ncbi:MAG: rhamnulokinase [Candidatus Aminicenantes bacterium]|nr:rhamnulokinase [Candidatus Aminicenantes bacterium]
MPPAKFLAFDFGAESGRTLLGILDKDRIRLEEIHRFPNTQLNVSGHIHWDVSYLFGELKKGLACAAQQGHRKLSGLGVDTWGVDFGLVGKDDRILGNPYAYRDRRTEGMMEKAFRLMSKKEFYSLTGIQFMQFNSVFQLLSMLETEGHRGDNIATLLFMPDLFNFLLTGEKRSEYTIASTSQLLNAKTRGWEPEIFEKLGLPLRIMAEIIPPGTLVGRLKPDIARETNVFSVDVVAPACHDTASAVAAVPAQSGRWAYLSSGTWSLLGVEVDEPVINEGSRINNFTNEGGVDGKIRFLRNTMGLWLLQRCLKSWELQGDALGYDELSGLALEAQPFRSVVDPDDHAFLNPSDMPAAIREFCRKTEQRAPENKGDFVRCILESLALKYRFLLDKINAICPDPVEVLHIVGGGSQNEVLNQFSSDATGLPVIAGPVEATAVGNVMVQAISKDVLSGIEEGRKVVSRSFPLKNYEPENQERWDDIYGRVKGMFS